MKREINRRLDRQREHLDRRRKINRSARVYLVKATSFNMDA